MKKLFNRLYLLLPVMLTLLLLAVLPACSSGYTTPTPTPTPTPASMADLYFLPMSIIIIVAIVVIGALLAVLVLRKHP